MFSRFLTGTNFRGLKSRQRRRRLFLERMEDRRLLADLSIIKTGPADVIAGEEITYDISVFNGGPVKVSGATVVDTLPPGLTYLGDTNPNGCTISGSTLTCDLGDMLEGDSVDFKIKALVAADFVTKPYNEVQTVTLIDGADTSTFTLTFLGQTTANLEKLSTAAQVQTALEALSTIGAGNVAVTGSPAGPYTVTFQGTLGNKNVAQLGRQGSTEVTVVTTVQGDAGTDGTGLITNTATVFNNEVQRVLVTGGAGTFTLNFYLETTAALAFDATPAQVQTALEDLLFIAPGDVAVTQVVDGDYIITFQGTLANVNLQEFTGVGIGGANVFFDIINQGDSDFSNNSDTVVSFVGERADLRITKVSKPDDFVRAGQDFIYTITVENLGPSYARGVRLSDLTISNTDFMIVNVLDDPNRTDSCTIIPGFGTATKSSTIECTLIDASPGAGGANDGLEPVGNDVLPPPVPNTGLWKIQIVARSSPVTLSNPPTAAELAAAELSALPFDVDNTARVFTQPQSPAETSTPDPDTSNNTASDSITVTPVSDLQIFGVFGAEVQVNGLPGNIFNSNVVTPMPDPACCNFGGTTVTAGRRIQWDSTVLNAAPSAAQNVKMEVLLPFGATLIENTLTGSPLPLTSVAGRCIAERAGELRTKVTCEYGTLLQGQQGRVQLQVLVDPSLPVGTQLSIDASTSSDTFDPDPSNNITGIQFDTNAWADLAISKTDAPDPVLAGNDLTYTLTATNKGPSDAQHLKIADTTPAHTTFGSALPSPGGFCVTPAVGEAGVISCTWDEATAPAATRFVILRLHVDSSTPDGTIITNTASTSSTTPDPFLADNTVAGVTTAVDTQADLLIDKTSNEQKVDTGTQTSFTIFVQNLGPSDAVNVVVVDTLPAGVTFETDTDSCVEGPVGTLTCSLGTLGPGEIRSFDVFVFVDPSLPPNTELTNTATVSSDTPDPDLSNNTDTSTILALRTDTDLQITKDAPATAEIGTLITYTITVTNAGLIPATNVEVKDFLPLGLRPQTFTPSVGNCIAGVVGDALRPTVCNLGTLAAGESAEIVVEALVANNVKDQKQLFNDALVTSDQPDTNPEDNLVHSTTTAIQTANGNVSAKIFGGNLVVTGDIFNNKLRIEAAPEAGPDAFRITPFGGTKLNGRFESYQVHGVRLYASFNMQSGNDGLFFDGPMTLRKSLNITLGQGNDRVEFFDTIVRGNTHIVADGGADTIAAVDALFGGRVDFRMGSGADDVSILNSKFNSVLDIRTGSAKDTVTIESSQVVGKLLVLNESHSDLVTLIDSVFSSFVELQGGTGLDTLDAGPSRGNTFVKGKTVKSYELILP